MGKVFSSMVRVGRNFNVEQRAERVVEKAIQNKPVTSPLHPSTAKMIEDFNAENPEILESLKAKDEALHKRLEGVIVEPGRMPEIVDRSHRALPKHRGFSDEMEYGYTEPTHVKKGHTTIRLALDFISRHKADPEYSAKIIAKEKDLDPHQVKMVLKHFQMLELRVPEAEEKPASQIFDTSDIPSLDRAKAYIARGSKPQKEPEV